MTLPDVEDLFAYWDESPPAHEILAALPFAGASAPPAPHNLDDLAEFGRKTGTGG